MLQLIFGTAGSGKSYKLRSIIKEKILSGEKKLMLIVPEQHSFENEREMLKILGPYNSNKVEVMSFTRLTNLVFRKVGGRQGVRIDDALRSVLMSMAIEEAREKLSLYKEDSLSEKLVEIMVSALKEFKMCSINTDEIFNISKKIDDTILSQKLNETALILSVYDSLMSQTYIEPLDDLTWLAETIKENDFFKDYVIFIDSFNGFTMQEIDVIKYILCQVNECYVTLCMDDISSKKSEIDLFFPVYKTAKQLINISKENDIKIKPYINLSEAKRFENDELKHLEGNIYRINKKQYLETPENIIIYSASNLYSEADFVSNTIKRLIIEENYNYRDFAVILRSTETYRGIIDTSFKKNSIPYFLDKAEPIDTKPIVKFVITAFEIINSSFSSDLIFRYLKTGLTCLTVEEISILENYVFLWNINGKSWKTDFTASPNGFESRNSENEDKLLNQINKIRSKVIEPLKDFENAISGKQSGEEISRAIYNLLNDNQVHNNLFDIYKKLNSSNITLAREQLRLWDLFMDILDQMATVLKNKHLTAVRYLELLRLMIKDNDISFIPQGIDQVTIGQADRIRLQSPKIVFLVGAVEGEFPRTPVPFGVFSNEERKKLVLNGINLNSGLERLVIEEQFLAYVSMSAPSQKLYISWPSSDIKGVSKKPSSIVKETIQAFPNIFIKDELSNSIDQSDKIWSTKTAFEFCAKNYNDDSIFSNTLKKFFENKVEYKNKIKSLEKISNCEPFRFKDYKKARELFGEDLSLSASQVEKFYLCKFQYFCKYGMKAKPKKQASFDNLEYGLVMHYLLENILKKYNKETFCKITKNQVKEDIEKLLNEYINEKLGGIEDKNARFKYLYFRLVNTAQRLVLHLAKEFSQSEFYPSDFEAQLKEDGDIEPLCLKLLDGSCVKIKGTIDRVDIMNKGGRNYVRVIDYKTGKKDFRLSDILYGLNMQMLIYLKAISKSNNGKYKNIVPSGILYMPASISALNLEKGTAKDKIELESMKQLKMNGLVLDDPLVINGMEEEAKGIFIPAKLKNGKTDPKDSIVSISELGKISKHAEKLIELMAETLHKGEISPNPVSGEYDACKWCEYASVCGHEDESSLREIKKLSQKCVMQEIIKEVGEDN